MFLPKIKISPPKFTVGDLLKRPDGTEFKGYYFEDYRGRFFEGKTPADSKGELLPIEITGVDPDTEKFVSLPIKPTVKSYETGILRRYYLKDTRNGKIIEVNKDTYLTETEKLYIEGTTIDWIIQAPARDILIEGRLFQGAATRNQLKVQQADQKVKGLIKFITKYDEFVDDGTFGTLDAKQKQEYINSLPSNLQK